MSISFSCPFKGMSGGGWGGGGVLGNLKKKLGVRGGEFLVIGSDSLFYFTDCTDRIYVIKKYIIMSPRILSYR